MSFGSAIFLFAFLPASAALCHLMPGTRAKNICLLTASLLFYGFGRLADLPILVGLALINHLFGLFLCRRRWVLALGVLLDLGALLFYKLLCPASLPLGISFFTFQAISYLADAYRDPAQTSPRFLPLLQYLCFFPNLISGPLWKFKDMRPMLDDRRTTPEAAAKGLRRFTVGLGKKLLLSAPLGLAVDAVYALDPSALDFRTAWLGAVCYALHLYLDFSGYSDMALGLGALFGFKLPENFDLPYLAVSISDFWRRWHISLSRWFRDYLYIPLGGNRGGTARTVANKLAVFLATGLWHGVSWTFVLWGLWHGLLSALETVTPLKNTKRRWYGRIYALLAVVTGFALFRAGTLAQGFGLIAKLFTGFSLTAASTRLLASALTNRVLLALLLGLLLSAGVPARLSRRLDGKPGAEALRFGLTLLLLTACIAALASGSFQPFIYQQF